MLCLFVLCFARISAWCVASFAVQRWLGEKWALSKKEKWRRRHWRRWMDKVVAAQNRPEYNLNQNFFHPPNSPFKVTGKRHNMTPSHLFWQLYLQGRIVWCPERTQVKFSHDPLSPSDTAHSLSKQSRWTQCSPDISSWKFPPNISPSSSKFFLWFSQLLMGMVGWDRGDWDVSFGTELETAWLLKQCFYLFIIQKRKIFDKRQYFCSPLSHVTQLRRAFKQCCGIVKARAKILRRKFVYFVERDVCQQKLSSSTYWQITSQTQVTNVKMTNVIKCSKQRYVCWIIWILFTWRENLLQSTEEKPSSRENVHLTFVEKWRLLRCPWSGIFWVIIVVFRICHLNASFVVKNLWISTNWEVTGEENILRKESSKLLNNTHVYFVIKW